MTIIEVINNTKGQENIWHVWAEDKGNEAGTWIEATTVGRVAGDGHAHVQQDGVGGKTCKT